MKETGPIWYVVHTNPRCEERAAAGLEAAGFLVHLPRGAKFVRRRYTTTRRLVRFPLFTGYLFVGLSSATPHFFQLRRVDGVQSVLGAAGKPLPIAASDVAEFRRLEEIAAFTERRHPRPFAVSDKVTVRSGPFAGPVVDFDDYKGRKLTRFIA